MGRLPRRFWIGVASVLAGCAWAQGPANAPAAARLPGELPVREVTVFKDGHAFVQREASLPAGAVEWTLESLPTPVLGTFWPYATGGARLVAATAAKQRMAIERTALDVRQLLSANAGRQARIVDVGGEGIQGTLLGVPQRSAEELERADPAGGSPRLPEKGSVVLVQTSEGTRAIPLERVRDVTILGEHASRLLEEELRNRLTLTLERSGAEARVGVVYVQKGLRWIPAYKLDLVPGGKGRATVQLEATLVNDLIDLSGATVNLVIGVPRFEFAGMVDPIALQETAAELGRQMQRADPYSAGTQFLSNALMTQAAEWAPAEPAADRPGPEIAGGESNEDLFVFTVKNVTLAKGERMVLPIATFELTFSDVYTLEVPFAPPFELQERLLSERSLELARLLTAPKAMHALRLKNTSSAPLTTAPALILSGGKVLAQGLLTYTPIGGETDLPVTAAVDVAVERSDRESGRVPDGLRWAGNSYARIDMTGALTLTNRKTEPVELEVRRMVAGLVDSADHDGAIEQTSLFDAWSWHDRSPWWRGWSWPYYWHHLNGLGRITWKVRLEPGAQTTLSASWHYFWN